MDNIKQSTTEIRKGKWEWSLADNGWADHKCSACGFTINTDIHVGVNYPVCPKCGAILDDTRAFYNPKQTIFERMSAHIHNIEPLELMCLYNRYTSTLSFSDDRSNEVVAPMSMFDYIMKDYLRKTYLKVAEMVSEFDSDDTYFCCNRYEIFSSDTLIGDLISEEAITDLITRSICEYDDYNNSEIGSLLKDMSGPDPQTMDWDMYLQMRKEK